MILDLQSRSEEPESRLKKNSSNSNEPPSSDGLSKPKVQPASPRNKGKKAGGQPKHKGKTLGLCPNPDHINPLLPGHCKCGAQLDKSKSEVLQVRQVFDIPGPRSIVTEHQQSGCVCGNCGLYNKGVFPEGATAPVQYGVGARALVALLNIAFNLPLKKIRSFFSDIYGYAIDTGTIIRATQSCHERLQSSGQVIKQRLLDRTVAHFDETGLRVPGSLHWSHTCCDGLFTYLFVHLKRGKKALLDAPSLLPGFKNRAIHDCWGSYFCFTDCKHGICGAHLLRGLTALVQNERQWAAWSKRYLLTLYTLSDEGKRQLSAVQRQKALPLFDKIWEYADRAEPPPIKIEGKKGRPKATKGRNLLNRPKGHRSGVLAFAFYQQVPFSNDRAERDLRPAKTKQKVAGCFRKLEGAKRYARIYGFISTTRKHRFNIFNQLKKAFAGDTFLTQSTPS